MGITSTKHVPPHSKEAECWCLGSILLDETALESALELLLAHDFYFEQHRLIFEAIKKCAKQGKNVDVITVTDVLREDNQLEKVGGDVYLFELANQVTAIANVADYARIIREKAVVRELLTASQAIAKQCFDTSSSDYEKIIQFAEQKILNISNERQKDAGPIGMDTLVTETTAMIDKLCQSSGSLSGESTGFTDLDKLTGGVNPGDLIVVAGRPSMGKTLLALNIAEHFSLGADQPMPVVFFSLEMPGHSLVMRMLSSLSRIDQTRIRNGNLKDNDWPRISSAMSMLSNCKLFIDDSPMVTPTDIRSRVRRLKRKHPDLGLIVVDYLQLMSSGHNSENRTNEISEISRTLKLIAKEQQVPIIALSQLNRSLEQRQNKRPIMSDLRESGAIEQDADQILFIYRDEVYDENSPDKGIAEIIVGKNRNGPIGKIKLTFLGQYATFENHIQETAALDYVHTNE